MNMKNKIHVPKIIYFISLLFFLCMIQLSSITVYASEEDGEIDGGQVDTDPTGPGTQTIGQYGINTDRSGCKQGGVCPVVVV